MKTNAELERDVLDEVGWSAWVAPACVMCTTTSPPRLDRQSQHTREEEGGTNGDRRTQVNER
jgi:hypothetical protein